MSSNFLGSMVDVGEVLFVEREVSECNIGAFSGELVGNGIANATGSTRDKCYFSFEEFHNL
jgi:hypothetical protein